VVVVSLLRIVELLFFCNPSSDRREMLTVRRSDDGGATWSRALVLEELQLLWAAAAEGERERHQEGASEVGTRGEAGGRGRDG